MCELRPILNVPNVPNITILYGEFSQRVQPSNLECESEETTSRRLRISNNCSQSKQHSGACHAACARGSRPTDSAVLSASPKVLVASLLARSGLAKRYYLSYQINCALGPFPVSIEYFGNNDFPPLLHSPSYSLASSVCRTLPKHYPNLQPTSAHLQTPETVTCVKRREKACPKERVG